MSKSIHSPLFFKLQTMSQELTLYDKLRLHLFEGKNVAESYLSKDEMGVKIRIEALFTKMLDDPIVPEKKLRGLVVSEFGVSIRTAFQDVALTKLLFGNFKKASREYERYRVMGYLEWAAQRSKEKDNEEGVIKAADKMGKYNRLDQSETENINWEEVIPPSFEPTNDIEVLNIKRDPDIKKKVQRLIRKYYTVEDATIVE